MSDDWNAEGPQHTDSFAGQQPALAAGMAGPTFEDVFDTIKILGQRILGPLAVLWAACAAIDLVFSAVTAGMFILFAGGVGGLMGVIATTLLTIVAAFVVHGVRVALYAPMKALMIQGPSAVPDFRAAFQMVLPRVGACIVTGLLVAVPVVIGAFFCLLPGVAAAFAFVMAPYYAATGLGPIDSMKESLESVKRNWPLILGFFLALVVVVGLIMLGNVVAGTISRSFLGEYAVIGTQLVGWFLGFTIGAVAWVVGGAVFITIDSAESGQAIRH